MQTILLIYQRRSRRCRSEAYGVPDRPQKGRFRQFVQCDIDILGDATNLAEIEEILAYQRR